MVVTVSTQTDLFDAAAEETPFWENGKYAFKAISIEAAEPRGDYDPSNMWTFEVYELDGETAVRAMDDGTIATLRQFISRKMTPASRGRPLVEAIIGRKLAEGDRVTPDDILGKLFLGMIVNEVAKNSADGKAKPYLRAPEPYRAPRQRVQPNFRRPPVQQQEELDDLPF